MAKTVSSWTSTRFPSDSISGLMMAAALGLAFLYEALSTMPLHDMPAIRLLAVFLWLWVIAAVGVKRLHDRDRPGHLMAAPIVLGSIIAVVIAVANDKAVAILPAPASSLCSRWSSSASSRAPKGRTATGPIRWQQRTRARLDG
ncbi:MAG TPA: DUF805 domain-containing protein [Methyloceanibacter sp.]